MRWLVGNIHRGIKGLHIAVQKGCTQGYKMSIHGGVKGLHIAVQKGCTQGYKMSIHGGVKGLYEGVPKDISGDKRATNKTMKWLCIEGERHYTSGLKSVHIEV